MVIYPILYELALFKILIMSAKVSSNDEIMFINEFTAAEKPFKIKV